MSLAAWNLSTPVSLCALAASLLAGCAGDSDPFDAREDLPPLPSGKADDYRSVGESCGNFDRVPIDTADYICASLVASSDERLFKPRAMVELPGRPSEFLVTDLAGWRPDRGQIWYLDARTEEAELRPVLEGLGLPHQIIEGPGEQIYFGEDTRIRSFPPDAVGEDGSIDESAITTVIDGLPPMDRDGMRNSGHPISHFVFDAESNLYVNVGAYSDHCATFAGELCREGDGGPTDDPEGWGGVIRRYDFIGDVDDLVWRGRHRVVAFGLRNSMGLAFATNGDLLQVENGRDFDEPGRPFEELNVIPRAELNGEAPPKHYGWPYCYDFYETSEEWADYADFPCSAANTAYRPPHILLPPHGAPLGLTYYSGEMFPELEGRLIVPLHGYRPAGQRIVVFDVDPDGLPIRSEGAEYLVNPSGAGVSEPRLYPTEEGLTMAAHGEYLIEGWYEVDGTRPKGAPVAPYIASDGSIWVADDKNRSIFRLSRADRSLPPVQRFDRYPAYEQLLDEEPALVELYDDMLNGLLLSPQCEGCHDNFRLPGDESTYPELRYLLSLGTWIEPGRPDESLLYTKLTPPRFSTMPPDDRPWPTEEAGLAAINTAFNFIGALPDLEPLFNDGWIGGECEADADCGFEGGECLLEGGLSFCTVPCSLERPFCPDRAGNATTFCVAGGESGTCVAQCDPDAPRCLEGQRCVQESRYGRDDLRYVCR
ncbi:MAG: PQQ-dependent sugar dehydrogenase [Myxococcota bacterium]